MPAFALDLVIGTAVLLTAVPLLRLRAWWIRVWDFPRSQILVVLLGALAARLAFAPPAGGWGLGLAALGLVAVGLQLYEILPFTRLWRPAVAAAAGEAGPDLTFVTVNVLMTNRAAGRLLRILRRHDPDLVLAVEVDRWWCEVLGRELAASHPHRLEHPLDNTYGMALYSRLPFERPELRCLLSPEIPSIRTLLRLRSGRRVEFWGVHPAPPVPQWAESSLPRDAELVLVAREVAGRPPEAAPPPVVAGDLNDVAWSHTTRRFVRLSGLRDPRVGRGLFNSFHAQAWPIRWPLDHVFHGPEFQLRRLRRLPAFGSDHFPILTELVLAPAPPAVQVEEAAAAADAADHAEARATLAAAAGGEAAAELRTPATGAG